MVDTFNKNQHRIDLVVSEDEQFAIFSWETKMDCLGNQIKNIALYKTNEKVRVSSLYGTPMLYREISQTDLNHQMYYILGGNTAEETSKVTQKIYKITNGYIEEAQIPLQELSYNKKSLITFDE